MAKQYLSNHVWWRVLLVYVLMGLVFYWPFMAQNMRNNHVHAEAASVAAGLNAASATISKLPISGNPVKIVVPAIGLDLPVIPGTYEPYSKSWQISQTKANFAVNTQPVNTVSGTTLIYGHDTNAVFASLAKLKHGDKALVYTDNKHVFSYVLTSDEIIKPTDTTIFLNIAESNPKLALLTCDGYWSQNRKLLRFSLEQAK